MFVNLTVPSWIAHTFARNHASRDGNAQEPDGPLAGNSRLEVWRKRQRYRWHLKRLMKEKPELIKDVGLSLFAAEKESEKPFWRA